MCIRVADCDGLTSESIKAITSNCSTQNVGACEDLTDEGIKAIAMNCPSLTEHTAYFYPNLTDEAIKAIGANCPLLRWLDMDGIENIFHDGMSPDVRRRVPLR